MKLKRESKIRLFLMGRNKFEIRNVEDDVMFDADDNYFIYMKNVNFRNGNIIEGRYLGNLVDGTSLIDESCKNVTISDDGKSFMIGKNMLSTAKMVAVNNKTNVIVVIED